MVKFYRIKDTEIRKAVEVSENGVRIGPVALIGRAKELVERGVLTPDNTKDHDRIADKWLVVPYVNNNRMELTPYDTLAEAKAVF